MGMSFECGLCRHRRSFDEVIRVYEPLKNLFVIAWPCWCWQCSDLSLAEYVASPAEILDEAKGWLNRDQQREYRITGGPLGWKDDEREPEVLAYYDSVLSWRRMRHTPDKCLSCGSLKVSLAKSRYSQFEHPGCGGMFTCLLSIFGGIRQVTKELYSTEGIKLSEEQVVAWA